ncbi:uncharacterized protein LOC134532993 isoform X2 [Bacillus rossius redtenbacheri]|uniref:uncharacterized protein LOC134532993 isoform X2 n=1 Tax=Bacillus rossius redtenbacheri TaxID=93214 RepID=UPI002FDD1807
MTFGLGKQLRPCLRVVTFIVVFALLSLLYMVEQSLPRHFEHVATSIIEETNASENIDRLKRFLVWSSKCKIPDADPYQKSVMKLMKPAEPINCSNKAPLTYVVSVTNTSQYKLVIDTNLKNNLGSCKHLENETILHPEVEFILVKCHSEQAIASGKNKRKEVYSNMHAVVPIKEEVKWKLETNKSSKHPRRLSVLLLGLDSISRLNMIRKMPKTVSYLTQTGWVELKGYNKVGDNTLPNLMALLTGYNMKEIKRSCWPSMDAKFDDCPFIWKNFSKQGYITIFTEDEPTISTFNYHKTGFVNPPTDYYLRPYLLAAEQHLTTKMKDSMAVCLGPVSTADHILHYVYNFLSTFKDALYFGLMWLNNFSHNNPNTPGAMDSRMVSFFKDLVQIGTLNSSMIVFLSDHGMRFGKIRETSSGWLEERLPFCYVWVPEWFRKENPAAYRNVIQNGNHLVSPFDLHLSLRNILDSNTEDSTPWNAMNTTSGCSSCMDLFSDTTEDRLCEDAGITPHWCTCYEYRSVPTDEKVVQKVAKFVVNEIHDYFKNRHPAVPTDLCATLQVHTIVGAKIKLPHDGEHVSYNDYLITFLTTPGKALFESTVRLWGHDSMELQGKISRLNSYYSQSRCIADSELKPFCFCVK